LATALGCRGFDIVADDVTVLRAGTLEVMPGTGTMKLWPDSVAALGIPQERTVSIAPDTSKHAYPFASTSSTERLLLSVVYFLEVGDVLHPTLRPLGPIETAIELAKHTFRSRFIRRLGRQKEHLEQVAAFASAIRARSLMRPRFSEGWHLPAMIDIVLADQEHFRP
jgi:hypothetical protein